MGEINNLIKQIHEDARSKGWYDKERSPLELHMLMVSELAEATEEVRSASPPIYQIDPIHHKTILPTDRNWSPMLKPEGEAIEITDLVIRAFDYCGYRGWDLEQLIQMKLDYNKRRNYRHGNKAY